MHWPNSFEDIGIANFIAAIAVLTNVAGFVTLARTYVRLRAGTSEGG